jgi:hypothetical protein
MPRIEKEAKELIKQLPRADLVDIVIKMAQQNKSVYDFVLANYLDKANGENDLFEEAKADLKRLFFKSFKGFSIQLQYANTITACVRRINEFSKICKNKSLEADLLMYVLDEVFSYSPKLFGTCFTAFDYKTGLLLKRIITIIQSKLHPDFKLNYQSRVNQYLDMLHQTSNHLDTIYSLPKSV